MEPNQSKVIFIPSRFNSSQRQQIGNKIVERIRQRSQDGIDVNGNLFSGYSKFYEKKGTVDLTVSGNMLDGLEVLNHGPGFITIGFLSSISNDKAAWIQNPTGQKAGKQPIRTFVGISPSDLNNILESF